MMGRLYFRAALIVMLRIEIVIGLLVDVLESLLDGVLGYWERITEDFLPVWWDAFKRGDF